MCKSWAVPLKKESTWILKSLVVYFSKQVSTHGLPILGLQILFLLRCWQCSFFLKKVVLINLWLGKDICVAGCVRQILFFEGSEYTRLANLCVACFWPPHEWPWLGHLVAACTARSLAIGGVHQQQQSFSFFFQILIIKTVFYYYKH